MSQPVFVAGVGAISAIGNNIAECLDALENGLLPLAKDEVGADESPLLRALDVTGPVIDTECVKGIGCVRVVSIDE